MKAKIGTSLILLSLLVLTGCSTIAGLIRGEPDISGYIMDERVHEILVVSTEPADYSETGGTEEFYDAVWVSRVTEVTEIGDYVEVWFDGGVETSYPAQAAMEELEIIEPDQPQGADLTESEALRKALAQEPFEEEVLTVMSLSYDESVDEWTVELRNTNSYEDTTIEVEDE